MATVFLKCLINIIIWGCVVFEIQNGNGKLSKLIIEMVVEAPCQTFSKFSLKDDYKKINIKLYRIIKQNTNEPSHTTVFCQLSCLMT